jgi:disulfide bond formation protein DsbB
MTIPRSVAGLSFRQTAIAVTVACAGLLGYGYYLQYFDGQDPCPLCLLQRGFYYAIGITFVTAAAHGPARLGQRVYAFAGFLLALGGGGVATRQAYLQHLPPEQVPACGPDLFYMLDNFPIARTLQMLLRGSGQCAEVHWRFLGLSIAEWSLVWFALFAVAALYLALRKDNAAQAAGAPRATA